MLLTSCETLGKLSTFLYFSLLTLKNTDRNIPTLQGREV